MSTTPTTTLPKPLRTQLENTVKAAREVAEKAARGALAQLAVADAKAPEYLTDERKSLRRRLRAHGRALGDTQRDDTQEIRHLVWEVAYEQWHRMLFARFLAESGLLLWEPGAPVSLDDCRDMVDNHPDMALGAKSHWELAAKLAARMLPQVFKPQSPVFELAFAPEHQRDLERLLAALPPEVFMASDSLGWVYQFWQAKRKDEVNASEVKIGADELPAVTQLFTEPYMVDFLLHNSLGAWWVTRHPGTACPVPLTYLRTLDDGTPAAGKFEGWPDRLDDFKLLDPCCGSGHFLVAAFLLLVPMRMAAEGLSAMDAVDAVLAGNLHGLELDARCVEIAVFALALTAWRFPDENGDPLGVRVDMPAPQVACCGLKVAAKPQDWAALVPDQVPDAEHLREGLRRLHRDFSQAPLLGSLLDPSKASGDLFAADYSLLAKLLEEALRAEHQPELWDDSIGAWDNALTASGLLDAARLLAARYQLVVTNVPYLARGKQLGVLKDYCETHYDEAKSDLANVFLERCQELARNGHNGVVQAVLPQGWLYLASYKKQRETLLRTTSWNLLARLGSGAFEGIGGEVVSVVLFTLTPGVEGTGTSVALLDASDTRSASEKVALLRAKTLLLTPQKSLLANADAIISFDRSSGGVRTLVGEVARPGTGMQTFDLPRFVCQFWEVQSLGDVWEYSQSTVESTRPFGGCEGIVRWEDGSGSLFAQMEALRAQGYTSGIWKAGSQFWGRKGVVVSLMGDLPCSVYLGYPFNQNTGVLMPNSQEDVPALWAFAESGELSRAVRAIDQSLKVTNGTVAKVPFDAEHWRGVASKKYPGGLPRAQSHDPTQWLFHGHPQPSMDPLQAAVARLAGYRWPAETDTAMELADEARAWIARCDQLTEHTDDDGIVCLPSVRGEAPAHDRLLRLLIATWETVQPGSWKPAVLDKLLADADCAGKGLDVWLREKFFEQHAKRFQHRPFMWHVWDGL